MPKNHPQRLPFTHQYILLCVLLLLLLAFLLLPLKTSAQATLSNPTFHVNAGFHARYRDGNWVPVQVSLHNDGADFNGSISLKVPTPNTHTGTTSSILTYQQAVSLPTGSQKLVTLDIPLSGGNQSNTQTITVELLDANNQKVSSDVSTLQSVAPNDIFVGILSDQLTGFGPLSTVPLTDQTASIIVEQLDATTLPAQAEVLKNFNLLVLDNFSTSNLKQSQLTAIQNWVDQGGSLIVTGGPAWPQTLSPLPPDLLPVALTGTTTLPPATPLLPISSPPKDGSNQIPAFDKAPGSVTISTATPLAGSTVDLAAGNTPLLAQVKKGQGLVYYLAFDPTLDPVLHWSQASTLWHSLLLRTLGEQILTSNANSGQLASFRSTSENDNGGFSSLLQSALPNMLPPVWLILALLLGYLLMLGPMRLLLVRVLKKRDWSWRITLSMILLFSTLSYTLALQQKGTSIVSSSITVLQLNQPGATNTTAHVTTYIGVYVPNQGDFQVNIPGANLVQTFSDQAAPSSQEHPATISSMQNETQVKLQGIDTWALRTLVAKHDYPMQGGIVSHLAIRDNNTLSGTVTNNLPYALSDVYVLIGNHFQSLGHMAAKTTKQLSLALESPGSASAPFSILADQIAANNGLPAPYGLYYNSEQSMNSFQRHMAQLAIMSGENENSSCAGTPCFLLGQPLATSNGVITNNSGVLASGNGPQAQTNAHDPLLIPGASATFIGWVDHFSDTNNKITVQGSRVAGTQEAFIQAPLDVSFTDPLSRMVNLPPGLITSQLVDVQGQKNNLQTQSPGIYTLTTGAMTFEFSLPITSQLQNSAITMAEPSNLTQGNISMGSGISSITDINHLRTYLYNWQKHAWEHFTFTQFALSINNAQPFIDPSGRILVQFANQNMTLGTAVFSKPSLQLRGQLLD